MQKLKPFLFPFALGIAILCFMLVFMTQISIDFRLVLVLTAGLFLGAGYISGNKPVAAFLLIGLISLPFTLVFDVVIYSEIPQLIIFSLFFLIATWLGIMLKKQPNLTNFTFLGVFVVITSLVAFFAVPNILSNQLSEEKNETAEPFTMLDMEGNKIASTDLAGKVIVLDFFGTWCKPCIQELKELDKVYEHFDGEKDIVFFVINTAELGDTKEKMNQFIQTHDYPFLFGFDTKQDLVKQFELHGVPYLFIFDKAGKLRFQHVGYNTGESNFVSNIVEVIEELRN